MLLLGHSKFYAVRHSQEERSFYVDMDQKVMKLSFCQLLALRQKVNQICLESLFDSEVNEHGFKILTFCNHEHLFVLNIVEILDLKSVIQSTFTLMGLSSKDVTIAIA